MTYYDRLVEIIDEIDSLIPLDTMTESVEFKTWKRKTARFLKECFGEKSEELSSFLILAYTPLSSLFLYSNSPRELYYNSYKKALDKAKTTFQSYLPDLEDMLAPDKSASAKAHVDINCNTVFIVHGHDSEAKTEVARFLEKLSLEAIILHEQENTGKTIIEKIEHYTDVAFGIVLYTPCDEGKSAKEQEHKPRARQNVVFEHGYLMAKLGRERVVALVKESVEFPSDISGILYHTMDNHEGWKTKLAREMKAVGIDIDMNKIY